MTSGYCLKCMFFFQGKTLSVASPFSICLKGALTLFYKSLYLHKMKLLSFIFSIYFFALAVMPCCDVKAEDDLCKTQIEHSHLDTGHENHQEDICSPLCMCHCCGGVTLQVGSEINTLKNNFAVEHLDLFQQFPADITYSIWQPPKL